MRRKVPPTKPKRLLEKLIVDYGSFSGALIGAIGTIVAGIIAWYGVQDQLREATVANRIAEQTFLQSEIDKSFIRLTLLNKLYAFETRQYVFRTNISDSCKHISNNDYKNLKYSRLIFGDIVDMPSDMAPDLEKGAAGTFGAAFVEAWNAISDARRALQMMVKNGDAQVRDDVVSIDKEAKFSRERVFNDICLEFDKVRDLSGEIYKSILATKYRINSMEERLRVLGTSYNLE